MDDEDGEQNHEGVADIPEEGWHADSRGLGDTMSGSLTLGYNQTLKPAYGPLTLQYKSGLNAWTNGLTIDNTGLTTLAGHLAVQGTTSTFGNGSAATLATTGNQNLTLSAGTGTMNLNTTSNGPVTTGTGLFTTGGSASVSGALTMASNQVIRPAYGPLTLQYKSGLDTWSNGLTIDNTGLAAFTGGLTVAGNASFNGDTTLGNAATDAVTVTGEVRSASPLSFEGTTNNDIYTIFAITDPTGSNKTITFPEASGTVCLSDSSCYGPTTGTFGYWQLNAAVLAPFSTTADLAIGGTATSSALFHVYADTGNFLSSGTASIAGVLTAGDVIRPDTSIFPKFLIRAEG